MVVRLATQIVNVNTFAVLVDVGDRCARAPLETTAFMDAVVCRAARLDECVSGRGCECGGVKTGIDFAQVASIWSAIHDGSSGMRWWEFEFHLGKLLARCGEIGGLGSRSGRGSGSRSRFGSVVHFDELLCDARLVQKGCNRFGCGIVEECSECGVVGERGLTFFIYLLIIVDEILGVVAVGGVLECAKSGVCICVVVFTAACWRTTNAFTADMCARGDALIFMVAGLNK